MAVETVNSAAINARDAAPSQTNSTLAKTKVATGRVKESIGVAAVDAAASIASIYRLITVHSSWRVSNILLNCTAITSAAGDVGLYDIPTVNAGAAVDVDLFASAQSLASALADTDVARESGTLTVPKLEQPLWQLLGLSADPGKWYDVAITLTAAATAAGTVGIKGRFIDGN